MDRHLDREKLRKHTAATLICAGICLICAGICLICGSTGACETGAYDLLQYIFCTACGAVLVFVGWKMGKEELR